METIRNWISAVTAVSILVSAALAVTPEGAVKKILRFVGGLILFIVLIAPLKEISISDIAYFSMQYRADFENYRDKLLFENSSMIKTIIEDRTRTYILQKAEELGIQCDVRVYAKTPDDGYPYPHKAVIMTGAETGREQRQMLSRLLESELGISAENQEWRQVEDEQ
jgi:hypothetical protein